MFFMCFLGGAHSLWGRKTHKQKFSENPGTIPRNSWLCVFSLRWVFSLPTDTVQLTYLSPHSGSGVAMPGSVKRSTLERNGKMTFSGSQHSLLGVSESHVYIYIYTYIYRHFGVCTIRFSVLRTNIKCENSWLCNGAVLDYINTFRFFSSSGGLHDEMLFPSHKSIMDAVAAAWGRHGRIRAGSISITDPNSEGCHDRIVNYRPEFTL